MHHAVGVGADVAGWVLCHLELFVDAVKAGAFAARRFMRDVGDEPELTSPSHHGADATLGSRGTQFGCQRKMGINAARVQILI